MNPFLGARSVRTKVFAGVLLTTISALVVSGVIMVLYDLRSYHQGWVNDLTTQGELLGRASAPALQFDDPDAARALAQATGGLPRKINLLAHHALLAAALARAKLVSAEHVEAALPEVS